MKEYIYYWPNFDIWCNEEDLSNYRKNLGDEHELWIKKEFFETIGEDLL